MLVATTAKACGPRLVGLCCYGPCTAASCAGLLLSVLERKKANKINVNSKKFLALTLPPPP